MNKRTFKSTGMKYVLNFLSILLLFLAVDTSAQIYTKPNNSYGIRYNRYKSDSVLHIPRINSTNIFTNDTTPQIRVIGPSLHYYNDGVWRNLEGLKDGLIYGGLVIHDHDYVYTVTAAIYRLNGVVYNSPTTQITLSPADDDDLRKDIFVLTTASTAEVVEGIADDPALEPNINTTTQLRISLASVLPGTTEPGVATLVIYDETGTEVGGEFNYSDNTALIIPNSAADACNGTVSINGTNTLATTLFSFTSTANPIFTPYTMLNFRIKSKGAWPAGEGFQVSFLSDGAQVGNSVNLLDNTYNFESSITDECQNIGIPLADFGNITGATTLRFYRVGDTTDVIGFYIDFVRLIYQEISGGNDGILSVTATDPILATTAGQAVHLQHAPSGVTPGTYYNPTGTIDIYGHWTSAANGDTTGVNDDCDAVYIDSLYQQYGLYTDTLKYVKNETEYNAALLDHVAGLIFGGELSYTGTGLVYNVNAAVYRLLDGLRYESEAGTATFSDGDATFNRWDIVVLNSDGDIEILEGDPDANPDKPQHDPLTQIVIYEKLILAGQTEEASPPNIIYDEDTEWNGTAVGITVDFDDTGNEYRGTKATDVGTWSNNDYIRYVLASGSVLVSDYDLLNFHIDNKSGVSSGANIRVRFYLDDLPVTNTVVLAAAHGYSKGLLTYQNIIMNLSAFTWTGTAFDEVRISMSASGPGFYIDYVNLQNTDQQVFTESDPVALSKQITLIAGSGVTITGNTSQSLLSNPTWTIEGSQTWDATLIAGSTFTQSHTVNAAGHGFNMINADYIGFSTPAYWLGETGEYSFLSVDDNSLQFGLTGVTEAFPNQAWNSALEFFGGVPAMPHMNLKSELSTYNNDVIDNPYEVPDLVGSKFETFTQEGERSSFLTYNYSFGGDYLPGGLDDTTYKYETGIYEYTSGVFTRMQSRTLYSNQTDDISYDSIRAWYFTDTVGIGIYTPIRDEEPLYVLGITSAESAIGNGPYVYRIPFSQFAGGPGGSAEWGDITGTLSDQTDLQSELDDKQDVLSGTGLVKSTSGTISYITDNSSDWNTAYTDRLKWDGGSSGLTASTGRTSLGGTTVGQNFFTLTNPSAITFPRINADNTVSALDAAAFRTAIGAGADDAMLTALAALTSAQGDIIYFTGSDAPALLAKSTSATRYLSNTGSSNNPAWAQIDLSNGVTGALPNGNLANSTISGISLGSSLNDLTAGTGIAYTSGTTYNGGTARTITASGLTNSHLSGTAGITAANLSYVARSILVNNTGSTAAPTAVGYQEVIGATYAGTLDWDGTDPTSLTSCTYDWYRFGSQVTLIMRGNYATPGSSNTTLTITWPSGVPDPVEPGGRGAASDRMYQGSGGFANTLTGTTANQSKMWIGRNAADDANRLVVVGTSGTANSFELSVTYTTTSPGP